MLTNARELNVSGQRLHEGRKEGRKGDMKERDAQRGRKRNTERRKEAEDGRGKGRR